MLANVSSWSECTNKWFVLPDNLAAQAKPIAIKAALIISTLGVDYLLYQEKISPLNFFMWCFSPIIMEKIELPLLLKTKCLPLIKTAIVIHLSSVIILLNVVCHVCIWHYCSDFFSDFRRGDTHDVLMTLLLLATYGGYLLPYFHDLLKKIVVIVDGCWDEILQHSNPLKASDILKVFFLSGIFRHGFSSRLALALTGEVNWSDFPDFIEAKLEQAEAQHEHWGDAEQLQSQQHFADALAALSPADLPEGVHYLLSRIGQIVPDVMPLEYFLGLFEGSALIVAQGLVDQFLDQLNNSESLIIRTEKLESDLSKLEAELSTVSQAELFSQVQNLKTELSELRTKVEPIFHAIQLWKNYVKVCDAQKLLNNSLRFPDLSIPMFNQIECIYRKLIGQDSLAARLESIGSKLEQNLESVQKQNPITIVLGEKQAFKAADYDDLKDWLQLDSFDELDATLAQIGLATEVDLYTHNILVKEQTSSKDEVKNHLRRFILKTQKLITRPVVENHSAGLGLHGLVDKTKRVLLRLLRAGIVLIPILTQFRAGAAGFLAGSCFFVLKHFNFPGIVPLVSRINLFVERWPPGLVQVISLWQQGINLSIYKRNDEIFQLSFVEKLRRMAKWVFFTFLGQLPFMPFPALRSAIKGFALARQFIALL